MEATEIATQLETIKWMIFFSTGTIWGLLCVMAKNKGSILGLAIGGLVSILGIVGLVLSLFVWK